MDIRTQKAKKTLTDTLPPILRPVAVVPVALDVLREVGLVLHLGVLELVAEGALVLHLVAALLGPVDRLVEHKVRVDFLLLNLVVGQADGAQEAEDRGRAGVVLEPEPHRGRVAGLGDVDGEDLHRLGRGVGLGFQEHALVLSKR